MAAVDGSMKRDSSSLTGDVSTCSFRTARSSFPLPADVLTSNIRHLTLSDGRTLSYAWTGAPAAGAAAVCVYHHGVPASLVEAEPFAAAAERAGVAVVAFDRAGMGESSCHRGASVASVVDDTRQLMDALGLPAAVQVGESGGAPYAAACAAALPARTRALVLLAGLASIHSKDNAALRRGLNSLDRLSMSHLVCRWGGGHLMHRCTKLVADVSSAGGGCQRG